MRLPAEAGGVPEVVVAEAETAVEVVRVEYLLLAGGWGEPERSFAEQSLRMAVASRGVKSHP